MRFNFSIYIALAIFIFLGYSFISCGDDDDDDNDGNDSEDSPSCTVLEICEDRFQRCPDISDKTVDECVEAAEENWPAHCQLNEVWACYCECIGLPCVPSSEHMSDSEYSVCRIACNDSYCDPEPEP